MKISGKLRGWTCVLARILIAFAALVLLAFFIKDIRNESNLVLTSVFGFFFSFASLSFSWARLFSPGESPRERLLLAGEDFVMAGVLTGLSLLLSYSAGRVGSMTAFGASAASIVMVLRLMHLLGLFIALVYGTLSVFRVIEIWHLRRAKQLGPLDDTSDAAEKPAH